MVGSKGLTSNPARKFRPKFSAGKDLWKICNGQRVRMTIQWMRRKVCSGKGLGKNNSGEYKNRMFIICPS